jgi:transposase
MSNRWTGLTRFLMNARVPLDNGATERAMRGLAMGRKNHYGSRSRRGTEVAALYYSLLETAKLCGVESRHYLREAALAAPCVGNRFPCRTSSRSPAWADAPHRSLLLVSG